MVASVVCSRPIRILEAAYQLSGSDEDWLTGIVRAARPDFDLGQGVVAYLSRFEGSGMTLASPIVARGTDPGFVERVRSGQTPPPVVDYIRSHLTILGGVRQTFGGGSEPARALKTNRLAFDSMAAIVHGHESSVLQLVAPSGDEVRIAARTAAAWRKVLLHVGTALRLRQRLGPREALLTPDGKLADASEAAAAPSARRALVEAVERVERARSRAMRTHPEDALRLWQGLIDGRWSLVDHFEAGGRRYIAAHENQPDAKDPRALGPIERACVHYAMRNAKPRDIAYALGTTPASVSSALARAAHRLGLPSSAMFATLGLLDVERLAVPLGPDVVDVAVLQAKVHPGWRDRIPPAEMAVAELVACGLTDGEISERRTRSERTISNQVQSLSRRLGVSGRAALVGALARGPGRGASPTE